jgi:GMP synthase (glutamine-hydrolysing)
MKHILLLKAGEAAVPIRMAAGDYDRWFLESMANQGVSLDVRQAYLGVTLPRATEYDAVIMTGSPLTATVPTEWMRAAAGYLREAAERKVPVLGVCFGHQLLGYAYGAKVIANPQGREIGTVAIDLTEQGKGDPLFEGVAPTFFIQATHEDVVERAPSGATVLARNANTSVQAMAFGRHVRGVQFHPELQPGGMKALIESRAEKLDAEAAARGAPRGERVPRLLAGIRPSPSGPRILANFVRYFT